jgi:hypothetical protein
MRCDWPISLVAQVTPQSCWVAATSMLLQRSIPSTGAWVGNTGGLHHQDLSFMQQFFTHYGLRPVGQNCTITTHSLQQWLCRGAVMLISGYRTGPHNLATHALVVAGMDGNTFRFLDPSPVGRGTEISMDLQQYTRHLPYHAFWAIQKN